MAGGAGVERRSVVVDKEWWVVKVEEMLIVFF